MSKQYWDCHGSKFGILSFIRGFPLPQHSSCIHRNCWYPICFYLWIGSERMWTLLSVLYTRWTLHLPNSVVLSRSLCSTQRTFGKVWRYVLDVITWRRRERKRRKLCYWHLVGRRKECCNISYNAQDKLLQRITRHKMSMVSRLRNPDLIQRGTPPLTKESFHSRSWS